VCAVCLEHCSPDNLLGILCGHVFCRECWHCHFEVKIGSGFSTCECLCSTLSFISCLKCTLACFLARQFHRHSCDVLVIAMVCTTNLAAIECMQKGCQALVPEDFAFKVIVQPKLRQKYQEFAFNDSVRVCVFLFYCHLYLYVHYASNCFFLLKHCARKRPNEDRCKECIG
jgi:hypothetical protein